MSIAETADVEVARGDSVSLYGAAYPTRWRVPAFAALIAAAIALTFDAWRDITHIALRDEEASHIFLVPIAAIWLAWGRRKRFAGCTREGALIGSAIALAGAGLYCGSDLLFVPRTLWYVGAIMLVVGCFITAVGSDVLWRFFAAFAVLAFLVPIPGMIRQQIALPMGSITAQVAEHLLVLFGIPVERSGNLLSINNVDVTIAEACNGLRMVFALFLVSFTFAFATPLRWYVRLIILVAAPVSAIVCNVIRLIPTIWLYGNSSAEVASTFHDIAGWIMLVVSFFILMGIVRLLQWADVPVMKLPATVAN